MNLAKPKIAVIGAGNMGSALIGGLINHQHPPEKLWVCDPAQEKLVPLQKKFGVSVSTDNAAALQQATVVIFAVKPQHLSALAQELAPLLHKQKSLIISIAAGIRLSKLEQWLGKGLDLVRCMPNTPALVGCGASALYANAALTSEKRQMAETILASVGLTLWIDNEKQMDAVTALSGSGPAYFFLILEALQQAAKKLGLGEKTARLLSLQTAYGAARLALESEESVSELRRRVTSPGGTTEAALQVLEKGNLRSLIEQALLAAAERSAELDS